MNMYSQADIDAATAEGKAAGLAEGKAAGIEQGKAEGHAAGVTEGKAAGLEEGKAAGATAERERIKGIIGCEEAKGREASALHLALNTPSSVADAQGVLAGLSKAVPASGIASRQSEAIVSPGAAGVDTGEQGGASGSSHLADAGKSPKQAGAVPWDSIAAALNAEGKRARA